MIEMATHITTPTVKPTLEVVRNQFEAWRKRKRRCSRNLVCRGQNSYALSS